MVACRILPMPGVTDKARTMRRIHVQTTVKNRDFLDEAVICR